MKLGLHLNSYSWAGGAGTFGPTLARIAETAEAAGFDRISVMDHVWQHPIMGGADQPAVLLEWR